MKNKKNTLLFVAPSAYPLGGVATWLDYILPGLETKGWNIYLALTEGHFHNVDNYIRIHPYEKTIRILAKTGTREGRIRAIYKTISEIEPNLFISVNIPDAFYAIERFRRNTNKNNIRAVMTIHALEPDFFDDLKLFGNTIDAAICTNKLTCKLAVKEGRFPENRIFYAPYGVSLPDTKSLVKEKKSTGLRIGYSGRLDHFQKRVTDIPAILAHLNSLGVDYELVIAGSGAAENDLRKALTAEGLNSKVIFLGALSHNDLVRDFYKKIDVLLITSFWETGPIVAWEAMSHGAAVTSSSFIGSGIENSLKTNVNCLLFPAGNTQAAAKAIQSLKNKVLRTKIIEGGYELVKKRYTINASINKWDKCLRSILAMSSEVKTGYKTFKFSPSGRLDRFFGIKMAENMRELLGRVFEHSCPGGEWPHSYGAKNANDNSFFEIAHALDQDMPKDTECD